MNFLDMVNELKYKKPPGSSVSAEDPGGVKDYCFE